MLSSPCNTAEGAASSAGQLPRLPEVRTGGVIRQPSWLRGGPLKLLNRGRGLLLQEEGNTGRMSSSVADKSFPMNPC